MILASVGESFTKFRANAQESTNRWRVGSKYEVRSTLMAAPSTGVGPAMRRTSKYMGMAGSSCGAVAAAAARRSAWVRRASSRQSSSWVATSRSYMSVRGEFSAKRGRSLADKSSPGARPVRWICPAPAALCIHGEWPNTASAPIWSGFR